MRSFKKFSHDVIEKILRKIGNTDISGIGDGTLTGAISGLNNNLYNKQPKGDYALSNHNHSGVYQPAGSYAAANHNHSGVYQPVGNYAASSHTHDDRYYTESEINFKLNGKANSSHTHSYLPLSGGTNILTFKIVVNV